MPRSARLLLSKSYYHVMARANNKMTVFHDSKDYDYYLELVKRHKTDHPFDLYHYCLMPNHVHFHVRTKDAADFSLFMKKLNLSYVHHYRERYGWVGHFWQDRYKSQPIGKDSYFLQCGKYIELNPVRAGLVTRPEDYPYSSYRHYAFGEPNDLLTDDIFYEKLGDTKEERMSAYQKIMIELVVYEARHKKVWGSPLQRYNEQKKISQHKKIYESPG